MKGQNIKFIIFDVHTVWADIDGEINGAVGMSSTKACYGRIVLVSHHVLALGIHNEAGIIVFSILYGFFSGTFVSLPPATVAALSPDFSEVGTRMGMSFFCWSRDFDRNADRRSTYQRHQVSWYPDFLRSLGSRRFTYHDWRSNSKNRTYITSKSLIFVAWKAIGFAAYPAWWKPFLSDLTH